MHGTVSLQLIAILNNDVPDFALALLLPVDDLVDGHSSLSSPAHGSYRSTSTSEISTSVPISARKHERCRVTFRRSTPP